MRILDCESRESMYTSLSSIIGTDKSRIEGELQQFDINQHLRSNPRSGLSPEDVLLYAVAPSPESLAYDATCWFHLTRVGSAASFEQGILPLGAQIDAIWASLFNLLEGSLPKTEWDDFRHSVETDFGHHLANLYRLKTSGQRHWGPYAILIQDIAFNPKGYGNHDYLGGPEIIEDICACFQQYSGFNLRDVYVQRTQPCIVKFIDGATNRNYLKSAIKYLYLLDHETGLDKPETDSFDGKGQPILPDQVLKVSFP